MNDIIQKTKGQAKRKKTVNGMAQPQTLFQGGHEITNFWTRTNFYFFIFTYDHNDETNKDKLGKKSQ